jgi:hypothetical protein
MTDGNEGRLLVPCDHIGTLITTISIRPEGVEYLLVVFDIEKTVGVLIDKVAFGVGVLTEINFVCGYQCRRILVVLDTAGLEFNIEWLLGTLVVH